MIRVARLLPLSLGVLLACDGAVTTTPQINTDAAVLDEVVVAELQGIDVQPLGLLDKSVINIATEEPVTVAVMNDTLFLTTADLGSIRFHGAPILHEEQIAKNPECHIITDQTVYDADGNVIGTYTASLLHFDLGLTEDDVGDVEMCLTGNWTDETLEPFEWCAVVTVKNSGSGGHAGNGPGH